MQLLLYEAALCVCSQPDSSILGMLLVGPVWHYLVAELGFVWRGSGLEVQGTGCCHQDGWMFAQLSVRRGGAGERSWGCIAQGNCMALTASYPFAMTSSGVCHGCRICRGIEGLGGMLG